MKYIVILGDGMADRPVPELSGFTPLEKACKPNMDKLSGISEVGMVKTIPDGLKPGSDTANLSVMGYDPKIFYTGRSPLEAVSMGIQLKETDVTFRCNLVNLSDEEDYSKKTMIDYSSDEITTAESTILINYINEHLKTDKISFYKGISYRHCMVWDNGPEGLDLTPPHDISDKKIADYLPKNKIILDMMMKSSELLKNHPVNIDRVKRGLRPANSIWLWGEGKKPALSSFYEKFGVKGSVISAVDLIKGIGICAGLSSIDVEGATGNIDTNFEGKAVAALKELRGGKDFVYIHVEAPDECGHRHEVDNKVKSIELIDKLILGTILENADKLGDYSILILPDHPTPLTIRTHSSEPVPYILYRSNDEKQSGVKTYTEAEAAKTGIFIPEGHTLINRLLTK